MSREKLGIDPEIEKIAENVLGEEGVEKAVQARQEKIEDDLGQRAFDSDESQKKLQAYELYLENAKKIFEEKKSEMEKSGGGDLEEFTRDINYRLGKIEELLNKTKTEKDFSYGYKIEEHMHYLKQELGLKD